MSANDQTTETGQTFSEQLTAAVERDRLARERAHSCLTSAGSPTCVACRRERESLVLPPE